MKFSLASTAPIVGILACAISAGLCSADTFTAKVYGLKDHGLLYNLVSTDTHASNGHDETQAVFTLSDGKLAAKESAETDGGRLVKYVEDQEAPAEHAMVEVRGGRVYFTLTADAKTKTDDEKLDGTLLVPPLTVPFLRANWDAIIKGDTVDARFAAVDRLETVGFKFFKSDEQKRNGRDVVIVTMKPSSFIIAAIRSPMSFVFDKETKRVLDFRGQVLPKRDGKAQDAEIVYGH